MMKDIEERSFRVRKIILLLSVFAVLLFGTAMAASAEDLNHLRTMTLSQTAATETTVTVKCDTISEADHYVFSYWERQYGDAKTGMKSVSTKTPACTLNVNRNTAYYCDVEAYNASDEIVNDAIDYLKFAKPAPGRVTGFTVDGWGSSKGVSFSISNNPYPGVLEGVEWRLLTKNGKTVKYSGTTTKMGIDASNVALNQVYQFSVRGYSLVNGKKFFGPWYSKIVVPHPKMNKLKLASRTRIKVSWKKVSGATKYIIYGSTKPGSGYKKIATVKKNKTSLLVSKVRGKKLKKYKNYYFKVQTVCGKNVSLMSNYVYGYIYTKLR